MLGLIVTMAPTIGPVLGGFLSETYNWQLLFLINIIPGIMVCIMVWKYLDIDQPDWALLQKIDFVGIALIAVFLGSMQFVLEEGASKQWFEDHPDCRLDDCRRHQRHRDADLGVKKSSPDYRSLRIPQYQFCGRLRLQLCARRRALYHHLFNADLPGQR